MIPPKTQYVEHQGSLIAYQVFGQGPIDLLLCSGLASNVDQYTEFPEVMQRFERLTSFARVVIFDRRGTGHSDPLPTDALPRWEDWADDMLAVLDAVGSVRTAVWAWNDGGALAMFFAAAHPERVSALILAHTTARYSWASDYPIGTTDFAAEQFIKMVREKWGTEELASLVCPSYAGDIVAIQRIARFFRGAATPRVAAAHFRSVFSLDARPFLSAIQAPTLVMHKPLYSLLPIAHARFLAEHIPNALLIELPGRDPGSLITRDGDEHVDRVQEFLTGKGPDTEPDRVLATVLFCDIVGSTERATALGDRAWRELKEKFFAVAHQEMARGGGREVDTAGDGILMTFDRPARAIRCSVAIREAVRSLGLEVRCGLHTGECILSGQQVSGIAVHIGARVAATAAPGEIWVSPTVRDLVAGSGINFAERGTHTLKGVQGQWALYAVS